MKVALFCIGLIFSANIYAQQSKVNYNQLNVKKALDTLADKAFLTSIEKSKLTFNIVKNFSSVGISKADSGIFYDKRGRDLEHFTKVIVNADSTIAIGLQIFPKTIVAGISIVDFIDNAKSGFHSMVDSVNHSYTFLSTFDLKQYGATFGVIFSAKNPKLFMNRFNQHKVEYIAALNFQIFLCYFFRNKSDSFIDDFIKNNSKILEIK